MLAPSVTKDGSEVYVFPNPVKGDADPTIHIECGTADKIEIRIYNTAGEAVFNTEITGQPQMIDGKYAYEYTWASKGIASGVYAYTIKIIKKDAEPEIKKGRFAVLR